jgi:nitrogen fixation/metabolism regulation signal transduction histidine kinase
MTVRSRLVLTIIGVSLLMAAPAIYAVSKLNALTALAREQQTTHAQARVALGKLNTAMAELERYARGYIIDGTEDQRVKLDSSIVVAREKMEELEVLGYGEAVKNARAQLMTIAESIQNVENFMTSGRKEEATTYFRLVRPLLENEATELSLIAQAIEQQSRQAVNSGLEISTKTNTTTVFALLISAAAVVIIGYWTTYALTTPVRRLRRAMADVAAGQYVVPEDRLTVADEIGDLARSFSWMTEHRPARQDESRVHQHRNARTQDTDQRDWRLCGAGRRRTVRPGLGRSAERARCDPRADAGAYPLVNQLLISADWRQVGCTCTWAKYR